MKKLLPLMLLCATLILAPCCTKNDEPTPSGELIFEYVASQHTDTVAVFSRWTKDPNIAYVDFYPNPKHPESFGYILGTLDGKAKSALIYNRKLPVAFDKLTLQLTIEGAAHDALMSIGYVTDHTDASSYVKIKDLMASDYPNCTISLAEATKVPADAYLTFYYAPTASWQNNTLTKIGIYKK